MESGIHKFSDLFSQLGLPDDSASIDAFRGLAGILEKCAK